MNALTALFSSSIPRPSLRQLPIAARPVRRERDFGVGYGSSSGYGTASAYASPRLAPRFRFN